LCPLQPTGNHVSRFDAKFLGMRAKDLRRMQREQARLLRERDDGKPHELSSSGEAKAVARKYRRWRDGKLGTFGPSSRVRYIDPVTGNEREPSNGGEVRR
jgi:hypothetical protein